MNNKFYQKIFLGYDYGVVTVFLFINVAHCVDLFSNVIFRTNFIWLLYYLLHNAGFGWPVFVWDFCLWVPEYNWFEFSFLVMSFSGIGIKDILFSYSKFWRIPPLSIFWHCLYKIGAVSSLNVCSDLLLKISGNRVIFERRFWIIDSSNTYSDNIFTCVYLDVWGFF